jgi:hypothetical protein
MARCIGHSHGAMTAPSPETRLAIEKARARCHAMRAARPVVTRPVVKERVTSRHLHTCERVPDVSFVGRG